MPKVYCGEEHINIPSQEVRDAQVEKAMAMLAEWTKRKQQKRKFQGREWIQPGEAIRASALVRDGLAQLKAEE